MREVLQGVLYGKEAAKENIKQDGVLRTLNESEEKELSEK